MNGSGSITTAGWTCPKCQRVIPPNTIHHCGQCDISPCGTREKVSIQPLNLPVEHGDYACCKTAADASERPIFWNPWNRVMQCHACGQVWEPKR